MLLETTGNYSKPWFSVSKSDGAILNEILSLGFSHLQNRI